MKNYIYLYNMKVLETVEELNSKIFEEMGEDFVSKEGWIFEYSSDGYSESITFNGTYANNILIFIK